MTPDFFDNRSKILKDDLVAHVQTGDKMSVAVLGLLDVRLP